jgi:anaerobic selenocysteine-containing dehydrogenase
MTAAWRPTACILYERNCGIVVQTKGRTLAKIRGDNEHPASKGYTCNKALRPAPHGGPGSDEVEAEVRKLASGT